MDTHIDIRRCLNVFERIKQHGTPIGDETRLNGIDAWSDFDGYNIVLHDDKVKLSIGFHNRYHLDYPNPLALNEFKDKLATIEKQFA